MLTLGPLAFLQPWLLAGLLALPVLWWLLRVLPPAPKTVRFPAIRLLFGLESPEKTPDAAPWWLILLRLLAAALLILAIASPVLNPERGLDGEGPLVLIVDDGYAAAPAWGDRQARLASLAEIAGREGRPVRILTTARAPDGAPPEISDAMPAARAVDAIDALSPKPWPGDREAALAALQAASLEGAQAAIVWAADGLDGPGTQALVERLTAIGALSVLTPDDRLSPLLAIPPRAGVSDLAVTVRRADAQGVREVTLTARGPDGRPLARQSARFEAGEREIDPVLDIPRAVRNDLAAVTVEAPGAAPETGDGVADEAARQAAERVATPLGPAATALFDERWARRPVGVVSDAGRDVGLALLSEVYYLDRALAPVGDLSRAPADILIRSGQTAIFLPDSTPIDAGERAQLQAWIEEGGVLVRFAGPRLAQAGDDALTPVALRRGGRQLSGALQWTEPAKIGTVSDFGPFAGLDLDSEAVVKQQVLAEPSLDLEQKTWMRLEDDTPLVTAERRGDGWLVLVHTTANTEWSTLALSGLFVEMLQRLTELGAGVASAAPGAADRPLAPVQTLDGFGRLVQAPVTARPIPADQLASAPIGPAHPPGFYGTETARHAVNLGPTIEDFRPFPETPPGVARAGYAPAAERPLAQWIYLAAFLLLLLDGLVTLVLRGQAPGLGALSRGRAGGGVAAAGLALALLAVAPGGAAAQNALDETQEVGPGVGQSSDLDARGPDGRLTDEAFALRAASATTLAYVRTGDPEIDRISEAGLKGLAMILRQRTAVEAAEPLGVDVREDDLSFFPLLYWPVTDGQPTLHQGAVDRLNEFLANGGTILFDTRDAHLSAGRMSAASDGLRRIARGVDIPELTPVPPDHVLTKSFYLMQDFPGRWTGDTLWIEKPGAASVNDGVARVLVGGADFAGAWAIDDAGRPLFPVSPGGDRQRELSYRFGVNLVMYALTGNYKADQVHIPAILERLGQ
ncbi:MAG: DUF4159 domain-containing protein [Marivibrio sp.]|uniref:DUF4159 domain-containing protein n=1 Tax=Marivibrio sp. TaxID=2039719 RepID=UPI0032EC3DA8